ncbi:MAG: glycoside hydrolase family 15 protein [Pyrinomonadaceae bacterium]
MRDIPIGNGSLLINFDDKYQIRDIYFPHVGQENHTEGFPFRFGIWVDGKFSWVFSEGWERSLKYESETLVTDVTLIDANLGVEIRCSDTVGSHENVFLRHVLVKNLRGDRRHFRIFLHHDFRIYENKVGDTALFDPETHSIIHYKKHRQFLISTDPPFDSFATGRKAFRDKEGTWRDAEDGELHGGAITEGSVDSTIKINLALEPGSEGEFYYWIAAALSYDEACANHQLVKTIGPGRYLEKTRNYWRAWVNKNEMDLSELPAAAVALFKRSLLIIRTQIDNDGAILAANDADVRERATDHYSYLWTRDGAFVANALDAAGYSRTAARFYAFCGRIVHRDGYFLQKYNADGTLASGWHASFDVGTGERLLPIQEDETALVLWAFWEHYQKYRDIEFAQRLYRSLVVRCADFMVAFRHPNLHLPNASWNLWEDRRGIHTFTCATVVAGLRAAANFAALFGDGERDERYRTTAEEIVSAMRQHLFDAGEKRFARAIEANLGGEIKRDLTVDASLFAVFYFGVFDPHDEMVTRTMHAVKEKLASGGGIARYEYDGYMKTRSDAPGNTWVICTLWLADYFIAAAKSKKDLSRALEIIEWVASIALPSGVLSEQIDPATGEQLSVSPLTWSHSTFVATCLAYVEKLRTFDNPAD